MPRERYYSIAELGDGFTTATPTSSTTVGTFDSTLSRASILCDNSAEFEVSPPFLNTTAPTTIYIHGIIYPTGSVSSTGTFFVARNSVGTDVIRLRRGSTWAGCTIEAWTGAAWGSLGAFGLSDTERASIDIHIVCGAPGSLTLYVNKSPQVTTLTLNAAVTNIAQTLHGCSTNGARWSQMAAANFDLRDLLIKTQPATAVSGTNADWTGDQDDINQIGQDDTTVITTDTAGDKTGFTKDAYALPANTEIDSVWIVGRGRTSSLAVTDMAWFLRSGATEDSSDPLVVNGGMEPRQWYWEQDPNTSAVWTAAGNNAAEFGVEALA
jgi:hypothetical protein